MSYSGRISKSQRNFIDIKIFKSHGERISDFSFYDQEYIQTVSIDPGMKNLGLYIERRYKNGIIDTIILISKNINHNKTENSIDLYNNVDDFLDEYKEHYKETHYFIVEYQEPEKIANVRMMQHLISYFIRRKRKNRHLSHVIELNPKIRYNITNIRGDYRQKKKQVIEKTLILLKNRRDKFALDIMNNLKKKDDVADCIFQVETFFMKLKEEGIEDIPLSRRIKKSKYIQLREELEENFEIIEC